MRKLLWMAVVVLAAAALVSCQSPGVRKSKAKPEPKPAAVSTEAPTEPKAEASAEAVTAETPAEPMSDAVSGKSPGTPKEPAVPVKAPAKPATGNKAPVVKPQAQEKPAKPVAKALPRLVDLGATKCIPCKMMAPILEELAKDYKGKLKVEFIDVWENRNAGEKYGVRVIPTQIFFDEKGEEFFRHEGFYSKEDILRKFNDQGIELDK